MIKNIDDLTKFVRKFEGTEKNLNITLLNMFSTGELTQHMFLEYLAITQSDLKK